MSDPSPIRCPRCGAILRADEPLCPACLITAATADDGGPEEEKIFQRALAVEPASRVAFVQDVTRNNPRLGSTVLQLLAGYEEAGGDAGQPTNSQTSNNRKEWVATEEPGVVIGPFRLIRRLGEGGMGTVWRAEQTAPVQRTVALKVIKLGMDTREVVRRFERERQTLALLNHPNIAHVFEAGATAWGRPYFAMELVEGEPITAYCKRAGLGVEEILRLFLNVCAAVEHAHQKGIIHRDLKPSNILVSNGTVKVIDFGVAKATQGQGDLLFTQHSEIVGTPAYMSPEQADTGGLDIDTRSDIYSLGVLLYELLVGSTPFDTKELMSLGIDGMRRTILEKEPTRPSTKLSQTLGRADARRLEGPLTDNHGSDDENKASTRRLLRMKETITALRGDLDWIVMKCLEKDRVRRYATANGLAMDIQRHLNNEPVVAHPPGAAYKFQKAFRRNKLVFTAGVAVMLALIIGLGVATWMYARERQAHQQAIAAEQEQGRLRVIAQAAEVAAETNAAKARAIAIQSRRSQYAADLIAETREIERANYGNARNLLREFSPREGLEELRGFEWRYLWQLSAGEQLKTFQSTGKVMDMAWSPDGRLLAEGNSDHTLKLLRSDTGEVVSTLTGHLGPVVSLAFSFDGNGLVTAGEGGQVRFWNLPDDRVIFTHVYESPRVACSPTGPLVAIGTGGDWWGENGADVHLLDAKSGNELKVFPNAGDRAFFSPDGKWLATANWGRFDSGTQGVILWDVNSGQKLNALEHINQVLSMAFSPDGSVLAIGNRQGQIILWHLSDFSHEILRPGEGDIVRSVAFSPDGQSLAAALLTQEVEIWDVGQRRQVERLHGHTSEVVAVAFSPNGTQLASASWDGTIRLWDPHPSRVPALIPKVRLDPYLSLTHPKFSPNSRWLAAAITGGDVQIVDPTTAAWNVRTTLTNAGFPVAFSGDASTLLTLDLDFKTFRRWNVTSGELLSTNVLDSTNAGWQLSAITPDGSRLALVNGTLVEVFDPRTGRCLDHFQSPIGMGCLEFSPDGQWLAIGGENSGALWDMAGHRVVWTLSGHKDRFTSIRFSPDQKTIATTSWDYTVRLWDAATGASLAVLTGHKAAVLNSVFSPDGRTLVTGCDDRTIKFWNLATLREVASIPVNYAPNFLAFSPDEQILTANNGDSALRCWRAASLAEIDATEVNEKAAAMLP